MPDMLDSARGNPTDKASGLLQINLRKTLLPIAALWTTILLVAIVMLAGLEQVKGSHLARSEDRALSLAKLVATHTQSLFDATDLILQEVIDHMDPEDSANGARLPDRKRQALQAVMLKHLQRMPKIVALNATDSEGIIFASTAGVAAGISLADRPYFQDLKSGARGVVISPTLKGRISQRWGMQLARAVRHPDGRFAGMLVANVGLEEGFIHYFRTFRIGENSLLGLRDTENHILVRYPVMEEVLGKAVGKSPSNDAIKQGIEETVVRSTSPVDGQTRVVGLRRLDHYPIYATGGISVDYVLQDYYRERNWVLLFMVLCCFGGALQTRLLLRQDTLHRELTATNGVLKDLLRVAEIFAGQDQLTGLLNRRAFDRRLAETVARSERSGSGFSLLMLDLDHFKNINDRLGHAVGDLVLQDFASVLSSRLRTSDSLARWGGEEFAFIAEGTDLPSALAFAEDLRSLVAEHTFQAGEHMTVSIGVVAFTPGEDGAQLVARADAALYRAKNGGRNQVSQ